MYREDWHNKTDNIYQLPNGSWIEFFGLEDAGKARGPGRDILFINEANLVSKDVFDQLDMRTRQKVIIDLNPADFDSWCYHIADGPDAVKCHSTYLDNPYLSDIQKRVIESYRVADPEGLMWKVYGLGQRGASKELVYTHWKTGEMPGKSQSWYGLDFGYNVPTALVKVEHHDGCIYVRELLYQTSLTTQDVIERLKDMNISRQDEIYCDAAEPKAIEEICRAGFMAIPADKDVKEGIRTVKSYPLYISPESKNLIKELSAYKYKVDKNDEVQDDPVKANDHACDAMRYAVFTRMRIGQAEFFMM
jgi:phage terminase large subunit